MRRIWGAVVLWALAGAASTATPAPADTPEGMVRAYMADYRAWNDAAVRASETLGNERGMRSALAGYDRLLAKYCRRGFRGEPIAYGSEAHDPANERVLSVQIQGERATVKTRQSYMLVNLLMEDDYEYELSREHGRWYLDQVYYVDSEGRYPGL